jgi:homocysteine S-methyltransferase
MAPEVVGKQFHARPKRAVTSTLERSSAARMPAASIETAGRRRVTNFERKLGREFVITAEVSPPRGSDYSASLSGAKLLESVGVDAVHITDNPTARLRMAGTAVTHLVMRETSLATVLHLSCRDRNLLGLQSELLGAAALGIPAVLALTGDPSNIGDFPKATSVFDVTAVGLTRIIRALNEGRDHAGNDIGSPTHFLIGTTVNPLSRDLASECLRFDEKIAAGATFAVTQPVFDPGSMRPFLEHAQAAGIPVLVGLLPLRSFGNAEYLHNEVPGMHVPANIRDRMRSQTDQRRAGAAIARDLLAELMTTPGVAGAYVISQEQYELAAEVIAAVAPSRATTA